MSTNENVAVENVVAKKFRIACRKLSLTYPQCPVSRESMMAFLSSKKNPSIVVVSQEQHKDGNKHLHCFLQYETIFNSSKPTCFDITVDGETYHPNIQPTKDKNNWISYIIKTDANYLSNGIDVPAYLKSRKEHTSYCFYSEVLKKGAITKEMVEENPRMLKGLKNLLNDLEAYKLLPSEKDLSKPDLTDVNIWGVNYTVAPRRFKQPQLWICGSKNKGKTTFINELISKGYKGYEMPTNNDWSGYNDSYDFMFIDEFKGGITIQELNKVLQGNTCRLNTKGGMVVKNKNMPIFIVSNYRPSEVYSKVDDDKLDTLMCRLIVIENFDDDSSLKSTSNYLESGSNITTAQDCKNVREDTPTVVDRESKEDAPVSSPSISVCSDCKGYCVNNRCLCNACDICLTVECQGCQLVWSESANRMIMPRPKRIR